MERLAAWVVLVLGTITIAGSVAGLVRRPDDMTALQISVRLGVILLAAVATYRSRRFLGGAPRNHVD